MLSPPTLVPLRPHMEQGDITGSTLESTVTGAGELAICIHGAFISGAYHPPLTERGLAGHHRLITYYRHGQGTAVWRLVQERPRRDERRMALAYAQVTVLAVGLAWFAIATSESQVRLAATP